MVEHNQHIAATLKQLIAYGIATGEFRARDAALAARLVSTACIRFCHPRQMVEYDQKAEPDLDQMVDFCLAALAGGQLKPETKAHRSLCSRTNAVLA